MPGYGNLAKKERREKHDSRRRGMVIYPRNVEGDFHKSEKIVIEKNVIIR